MDAEHAGLGTLAQRDDVMLGAVGAQMDGVAVADDRIEAPDVAVESDRLGEIGHAELDAAQVR